jgi:hypothetical protein
MSRHGSRPCTAVSRLSQDLSASRVPSAQRTANERFASPHQNPSMAVFGG